jgi:hypothetical protein
MEKPEMEALLKQQVQGLTDFTQGYKQCAEFVLNNWDKKKEDATGIQDNAGNS